MDGDRWQDIQNILDQVFDLPPQEQENIITTQCAGDPALEKEVRSFLAADAQSNDLFDQLSEPMESDLTVTVMQAAKTFEQYDIIQKIGIGGMGVVYKVWDKRLERYIALKYLSPKLILDESVRKQFKTEARAASRIDHPNICAIYDIGESTENQLYFTMPFYTGKDLGKHIAEATANSDDDASSQTDAITPLQQKAPEMAGYALQIAAGLAAAHSEDILHRDIKPGNIMVTEKGIVKILDFGIAKIVDGDATTTQLMAGSTAYMSPEQTLGYKLDQRADIWSFGVVLYEMFTGQLPFDGKDNAQITQAVLAGKVTPLASHPNAPKSKTLERIIERTLQTELDKRCSHIGELFPDLQRLQSELNEAQPVAKKSDNLWPYSPNTFAQKSFTKKQPEQTKPEKTPTVDRAPAHTIDQQTFLNARPTQRHNPASHFGLTDALAQTGRETEGTPPPQADTASASKNSVESSTPTFAPATLKQIEKALLQHVGPVARVMVRRGQRKATCIQSLCELLASGIEPDQAKNQFLATVDGLW